MKIAMVGTGYVGLVTGTCFADNGHDVTCIDVDEAKIEELSQGKLPLYEPGLSELVLRNAAAGRLHFTTRLDEAVKSAAVIFLAVGTPPAEDGTAELSALWDAVDNIAPHVSTESIVVVKSTVPVGTNSKIDQRLRQLTGHDCQVVSNPEFFREGSAVHDCMFPDRIVIGTRSSTATDTLRQLYAPFLRTEKPILTMAPESAEMTKFAANALLAARISLINEMATICDKMAADIEEVRRGIGHDSRIGFAFLFPGVGYGGSNFPYDVRALAAMARSRGVEPQLLDVVERVNCQQKLALVDKIRAHFEDDLKDRTIALWGLAFKPRTDDLRKAPAITLIDHLLEAGARLCVHDPVAIPRVRDIYGERLLYGMHPMDVLVGADALAINTEWGEFRNPQLAEMRKRMKTPVIFDGRNLYSCVHMAAAGFTYYSIGRQTVLASESRNRL